MCEVAVHPLLRRLVVVGHYREDTRETAGVKLTKALCRLAGIVTPKAYHQRAASCDLLDDMVGDSLALLTREAGRLARRPVDDDEVRSPITEQMFEEALQALIVDLLRFGEGRDQRHTHPAEGMLTHSLSFYDQYVGRGNPLTQS